MSDHPKKLKEFREWAKAMELNAEVNRPRYKSTSSRNQQSSQKRRKRRKWVRRRKRQNRKDP